MTKNTEFSDAQILGAISAALRAGDMKAVVDLLHLLAVQSPREAQLIVDAVELLPGLMNRTVTGPVHWLILTGWDGEDNWGKSCDCEIGEDHRAES